MSSYLMIEKHVPVATPPPIGAIFLIIDDPTSVVSYSKSEERWFAYSGNEYRYFSGEYDLLSQADFQEYLRYTHVQFDDHWEVEISPMKDLRND